MANELETGKVNFVVFRTDYLQKSLIQPQQYNEAIYWANSHGITARELNDAILHTGSLDIEILKNYLKETGVLVSPVQKITQYLKGSMYAIQRGAHTLWILARKKKSMVPGFGLKLHR